MSGKKVLGIILLIIGLILAATSGFGLGYGIIL